MLAKIVIWIVRAPILAINFILELLLSRRGLRLGVLTVAAIFSIGAWIRPPSPPICAAVCLPLSFGASMSGDPVDLLAVPRHFRYDSVGAVLLFAIALGALAVLIAPRSMGFVAGVLVVLSASGNAIAMFNHPELVEHCDSELIQRLQIGTVLRPFSEESLAAGSPDRTLSFVTPQQTDNSPVFESPAVGSLWRGWKYLVFGVWMTTFFWFVMVVECPGSWNRRLVHAAAWTGCALAVVALTSSRRFAAEYHWVRAEQRELAGDLDGARASLAEAVSFCPPFENLQRTWLLEGKLDLRQARGTSRETYFRAVQLIMQNDHRHAIPLVEHLVTEEGFRGGQQQLPAPLRELAGLAYTVLARDAFANGLITTARDANQRANILAPHRVDCALSLATTLERSDDSNPDQIAALLLPLSNRLGDRTLRADVLERVGDAYFEAGQQATSRIYYQQSMDVFSLPKYANLPAQEGMLGL